MGLWDACDCPYAELDMAKRRKSLAADRRPLLPETGPSPSKRASFRDIGAAALLFGSVLLAYFPALHGGLIIDDSAHITGARMQSVDGLRRIWFEVGATQQYYPLLHTAFWVEHRLWGDAVVGYHLMNILLHAAAACLVVAMVRRLALPGAWLAGFHLCPASGVRGVGGVDFGAEEHALGRLLPGLGAASTCVSTRTAGARGIVWRLGLFVLALLTKTVTATLPAALLVVFWWRRGRLDWSRDVRPLLPWLALGAAAGLFTAWVERTFIGARGRGFYAHTCSNAACWPAG